MSITTSSSSELKYRRDIDGLRGIAILSVLAFHAFPQWIKGGFIGVDIFFVISGFLISSIILEETEINKFRFVDFYVRRINRIFPALIITLVIAFGLGWFILLSEQYKELCKHIAGGATFVSNFLLWNESGYFDEAAELKPLLHLWSLAIEEQFYIIWPFLLILSYRFKYIRGVNALAVGIITISFIFSLGFGGVVEGFYSPIARFWELMLGSFLASLTFRKKEGNTCSTNQKVENLISGMGFILLLAGFIFIDKSKAFPGFWVLLPTLGTCLLIAAGQTAWLNKNILSMKLFVWFGLISYPLYLYHWPLLSFARIFGGDISVPIKIVIVAISIFLALITYIFVEKPIRFNRYRKIKATILLVIMIVVGGVGYSGYATSWMDVRLPAEFRAQAKIPPRLAWISSVRGDICDIEKKLLTTRYALCYEQQKPSIFLWGDSHAAALYPGLKKLQTQLKFGIVQVTQTGCPPIFDLENFTIRKNCNEINEDVFKSALRLNPDIIVLHAGWKLVHYELTNDELKVKLTATLQKIKAELPSSRIIVLGPVPLWETSPKQVAFLNWYKERTFPVPVRQPATQFNDIDEILENVSKKIGVEFISLTKILCNDSGCIAKPSNENNEFIAWDYGHFTQSGSEFIVDKIKPQLFYND